MSCTPAEFRTALERAVGPLASDGDGMLVPLPPGEVRIEIAPGAPRRIGSLVLPVLHVRFTFRHVLPVGRRRFLDRFDLYSRRGGG